jgi:general secretion pathway protein G
MPRKGFTLIEVMIVVVIIGILAALAIPRFYSSTQKAKIGEARMVLKHIYEAALEYYQKAGVFPQGNQWGGYFFLNDATTKNLVWNKPLDFNLDRPSGYPRFTYLFWGSGKQFRAYAWGYLPDSWDRTIRKVNDLWIDEEGIIYGGTLMPT